MALPRSPGESRKIQVRMPISIDTGNVNANVVVIDDRDMSFSISAKSNSSDSEQAIEDPYCCCCPYVKWIAFIVLRHQIEKMVEDST